MYAAYQADGPSRQLARATAFTQGNDRFGENVDIGNTFRGRIINYCVAGTLGLLTPMYLHASSATANWNINQIEFDAAQATSVDSASSRARDVAHIRQVMKISVSELARVFGVSRQAVHEWLKGGALSPRNAQRLSELAHVADVFLEAGIDVSPQMLRRKVGSGPSLLESLDEEGKVLELARKLVDTLSRESQQRLRLAERLAGRQRVVLPSDVFGAPHLRENA